MAIKLSFIKTIMITFLGFMAAGFSISIRADICPLVESIVSTNPDGDAWATYLSPQGVGWRSDHVPIVDLSDAKFNSVTADSFRIDCVYDTPNGYLTLYPDDDEWIGVTDLMDDTRWYCKTAQSQVFPDRVEEVCTCTESLESCDFNLQPR